MRRAHRAWLAALGVLVAGCAHRARPASRQEWTETSRDCRRGDAEACYWIGVRNFEARDYSAAATEFDDACDHGVADGCAGLASLFEEGHGVARDLRRAFELNERACAGDSGLGCSNLGVAYFHGRGVAREPLKSTPLYKKACDLGYGYGCINHAWAVKEGRGVPADVAYAKQTWRGLCPRWDDACKALANTVAAENPELGLSIAREGCRAGGADSCGAAGWLLRRQKRFDEAERFLRTGCAWKDEDSCRGLGLVLVEKKPPDLDEGLRVLAAGCERGYLEACLSQALTRWEREGLTVAIASEFERVCRGGNAQACAFLCERPPPGDDGGARAQAACRDACRLGWTSKCEKPRTGSTQ